MFNFFGDKFCSEIFRAKFQGLKEHKYILVTWRDISVSGPYVATLHFEIHPSVLENLEISWRTEQLFTLNIFICIICSGHR